MEVFLDYKEGKIGYTKVKEGLIKRTINKNNYFVKKYGSQFLFRLFIKKVRCMKIENISPS